MKNSSRVIANTFFMYFRLIVTIGIAFYSVRLILRYLGVVDYGIYNLIAGTVSMLSFLNNAMTVSTQRFLSFYQGRNDQEEQRRVFFNSIALHVLMALIICLALEILYFPLFGGFLNIPADRLDAAKFIYHTCVATLFLTISYTPFTASINAHEDMIFIALINVFDSVAKLVLAFLIPLFGSMKLEYYGLGILIQTIVSFSLYAIVCFSRYGECRRMTLKLFRKERLRDLGCFAGWNTVGSITGMAKSQGLGILFNIFYNPAINAAFGISTQVNSQMNFFSTSMQQSLNPQIMKSEGSGDRARMMRLSFIASKFGFFLIAFISIPCLFEMDELLKVWLGEVPPYCILFCISIAVAVLIDQITVGLNAAIQATKLVKESALTVGMIKLMIVPVAFFLLKAGYGLGACMVGYAAVEAVAGIARIVLLHMKLNMDIKDFIQKVVLQLAAPVAVSCIVMSLFVNLWHYDYRFVVSIPTCVIMFGVSAYLFSLSAEERVIVNNLVSKLKSKLPWQQAKR